MLAARQVPLELLQQAELPQVHRRRRRRDLRVRRAGDEELVGGPRLGRVLAVGRLRDAPSAWC